MQQRKHRRLAVHTLNPRRNTGKTRATQTRSGIDEIPDRRARQPIRETPDKDKSTRCLSDRFRPTLNAPGNCESMGFVVCGETDESL